MPVIKANAYGHGLINIAQICDKSKEADRLCVASLDEALALLNHKISKPLLILSYYELNTEKVSRAVSKKVGFAVYQIEQARFLNKIGEKNNKKVKVHVKVDTGAARIGILPSQVVDFIEHLKKLANLELEGLWSHFASSEEDELYTERQYLTFQEVLYQLQRKGIEIPLRHMTCSAALTSYPKANFNAIRVGLSLYGLYPSAKSRESIALQPALSWFTKIIQVKNLPAGAKIGYGGTFTTSRPTTLAIIPVGYWDGYDRGLSNAASVLIKEKLCPIRGRICMNLSMVDVTDAPNVKAGDTAILIGSENNKAVTADELASLAGTINYEIVDRINPLLPRITK